MGTTADKLAYLNDTKAEIRSAITAKGVDVPETAPFRTYAEKIGEISGSEAAVTPLDPEKVYRDCRPCDWLTMPEPQEDEIYLLMQVPQGVKGRVAFKTTCTGSYTVEAGNVEAGVFTPDLTTTVASGDVYEREIASSECYSPTADGMVQIMLRVSGTAIETWETVSSSANTSHMNWDIVEIVCRLPSCTSFMCGHLMPIEALNSLRFFALFGTNQIQNMKYMFCGCYNLMAIRTLDTSSVTNMTMAFCDCRALVALPELDTSNVTCMNSAFYDCGAIISLPVMDLSKVDDFCYVFAGCRSLRSVPQLNTVSATDVDVCFQDCQSLRSIPPMRVDLAPRNTQTMFMGCSSLQKVTFGEPLTNPWTTTTLDMSDCALGHDAIIDLIKSLPEINTGDTGELVLYNVPGAEELTAEDTQLAAAVGWSVLW